MLAGLFLASVLGLMSVKIAQLQVGAASRPLSEMAIGSHVVLGSQQFIKLNNNGLLMMASTLSCPHGKMIAGEHVRCFDCPADATYDSTEITCVCNNDGFVWDFEKNACVIAKIPAQGDQTNCTQPVGYMDSWDDCASLAELETVCLTDRRDYRTYKVRKFADNKCWMVDSLRFGGTAGGIDGCLAYGGEGNFTTAWCEDSGAANCTAGGSNSVEKAQETFFPGYYGHCRYVGTVSNTLYNLYLYDWVAGMQSTLAYYGSATTFANTQQGICPTGWHIPTGKTSGEFKILANSYGTTAGTFWTESDKWNSQFSGNAAVATGALSAQGSRAYYWSSTAGSTIYDASLYMTGTTVNPNFNYSKRGGSAVRCIKD